MKLRFNSNIVLKNPPEEVLHQCLSDNTFLNPIYESNQLNNRSNFDTERTIKSYRFNGENLILPRGYMRVLLAICHEKGVTYEVVDERSSYSCVYSKALDGITLRPYQQRAIDMAMRKDQGVICSPTGSGKSLIGLELIRLRGQKSLILVHRKEIAIQWLKLIKEHLGIEAGFIGDGSWVVGGVVTVAMVQTLAAREEEAKTLSNEFGLILLDETHHAPAASFFNAMGLFSAKFRYGFSATLNRTDGLEKLIYRAIGQVIATIERAEVEELGATVPASVVLVETGIKAEGNSWHEFLDAITSNDERNSLIVNLAQASNEATLVLVDRVLHADELSSMLNRIGVDHVLAHGKLKSCDRTDAMSQLKTAAITIGTTSLLGEGLDVAGWAVLILASPISSEIKLMQAIGRIVRPAPGKIKATVYDLKDDCAFAGSSFKKRFEIYKKHGIWVDFCNKNAA